MQGIQSRPRRLGWAFCVVNKMSLSRWPLGAVLCTRRLICFSIIPRIRWTRKKIWTELCQDWNFTSLQDIFLRLGSNGKQPFPGLPQYQQLISADSTGSCSGSSGLLQLRKAEFSNWPNRWFQGDGHASLTPVFYVQDIHLLHCNPHSKGWVYLHSLHSYCKKFEASWSSQLSLGRCYLIWASIYCLQFLQLMRRFFIFFSWSPCWVGSSTLFWRRFKNPPLQPRLYPATRVLSCSSVTWIKRETVLWFIDIGL